MNKRAQITLFVVVAVIVIIIILMFFVLKPGTKTREKKPDLSVLESKAYRCLNFVFNDSIEEISLRGGYYNESPENFFLLFNRKLSYYSYNNIKEIPTKEYILDQILFYMKENSDKCFPEGKFIFKIKKWKVYYEENSIELTYEVYSENSFFKEGSFIFKNPVNFDEILDIANYIVEYQIENQGYLPGDINRKIQEYNRIYEKYEINITFYSQNNFSTTFFQLYNKKIKIKGKPYLFVFLTGQNE